MNMWDLVKQIRQRVEEEEGILYKQSSLRVALCHPAPYPVGMSSLGFQTIYREIQLHPGASAERAFLPDNPETYRSSRSPVITYENETPLSDFALVAFSIAYELELPGLLEMLDLSGIPPLALDRDEKHPLIVAGGPMTNSNPIILAPFIDLIILGEGEELIHELLYAASEMKKSDLLCSFSGRAGCFVPAISAELPEIARVSDESLPAHSQIWTQNAALPSMFLIEPERGCSRTCTYCVMRHTTNGGMRLVSPDRVFSLIPENARRVGLVGAAVTDHPRIRDLVHDIVASGREIGISSLRADRLTLELVQLLSKGGCKTLTTAADGVSQRLRDRINRKTTERHLIRAAELVENSGLERLKLYLMVGLPGETDSDIDEFIRFAMELSRIAPMSLSISPFVAKRNTPMDGAPFAPIQSLDSKLSKIRSSLHPKVKVLPASPRWAWVEYMLSQGGESAGLAAMDAWKNGGAFSSWKRAFLDHNVKAGAAGLS